MPAPNDMNPMTDPSSSEPSVSKRTILVAGLPCDIYGLEELASQQPSLPDHVSVLWLHHPRTRAKEDMAAFAARAVSGWHQRRSENSNLTRGLVAVVFDQRNHGGRLVEERANKAWRGGNQTHAVDMFGAISGMVRDTSGLMDLIGAHLKVEVEGILEGRNTEAGEGGEPVEWKGEVDHHCLLGVSLGGHSAWQTLFAEDRLSTAVVIIGCPDFMGELVVVAPCQAYTAVPSAVLAEDDVQLTIPLASTTHQSRQTVQTSHLQSQGQRRLVPRKPEFPPGSGTLVP